VLRRWLVTGSPPAPESPDEAGRIVASAEQQRLAGLLHAALPQESGCWPPEARDRLRTAHHAAFARGVGQLAIARRVLELLGGAGIRAVPMKGAALAEWLYASAAERPMGDVDVLVLEAWPRGVGLLRGEGFEDGLRADHAWTFVERTSGAAVELHHSVTSCPGLYPIDRETLWADAIRGEGQVERRPSGEDLLIQLCLHAAFQSGLVLSLVQYLDMKRLLERADLALDALWEKAERARALPALAAGLEAAVAVVAAPLPPCLRERLHERLPARLREWIGVTTRAPLSLVEPAHRAIGRVRWQLLEGRRAGLVAATVAPRLPGEPYWHWRRLARAAARLVRLVLWWLPSLLRRD
jgi:hypothetical protein